MPESLWEATLDDIWNLPLDVFNPGSGLPPMGRFTYSCTYTSKQNAGNQTYGFNPVAYTPSAQSERDSSLGVYTKIQMAIDIPLVVLNGYQPKPADFFTGPDGNTYNVIARQTVSLFFCRVIGFDPILSYQLVDTVNVRPPVDSTDPYLSPETTVGDNTSWNGLGARIEFDEQRTEDFQGVQFNRNYYKIWIQALQDNFNIGSTCFATAGEYAGTVFRIISVKNLDRLEDLLLLNVTVDPV